MAIAEPPVTTEIEAPAAEAAAEAPRRIREIPFNYTSYSDREIVLRLLDAEAWDDLNVLRGQRRTGRSARWLFEILGQIWAISRNPYLQEDLLRHRKRRKVLREKHEDRLRSIEQRANGNQRVLAIAAKTRRLVAAFQRGFEEERRLRRRALRRLSRATRKANVHFSPFMKVAHMTDATDWRLEIPFAVITPDSEEEIAAVVRACRELGLSVIPRGGGTGLCGGAVPLFPRSVVINTEKLDAIGDVTTVENEEASDPARSHIPTITAQCGAVTGRVTERAKAAGYVFATDPTSLWACTIGGNVASNAGGQKAVMWGTCVDNLLAWRMVDPEGYPLEVRRLDHNMGKIGPEITARFRITRYEADGKTVRGEPEILEIPGTTFRTPGLVKDVTNKALGGLPGVQKEGTDGMVTSATFVLHRPFDHTRTVCLEFFGDELSRATEAIVAIKEKVEATEGVFLTSLEHFDEKYVKATGYHTKSPRGARARVVLLVDVAGDDEAAVARTCSEICRMAAAGDGEGFVAVSEEDRAAFWKVRGRMSAIARHTNAFKINEDVVIPLPRLTEYADFIERLNIELSTRNKLEILERQRRRLAAHLEEAESGDGGGFLVAKLSEGIAVIERVARRWRRFVEGLDAPAVEVIDLLEPEVVRGDETLFRVIQRGDLRISYRREVEQPLLALFDGYDTIVSDLKQTHAQVLRSRVVIATHMHAGDGNVHTNIPVNSNDYEMMRTAHRVVEQVMAKAVELGGVISGEHGIGITKLPYLDPAHLDAFADYKGRVDPEGRFNPGKLLREAPLEFVYTPSFRLLEQEAILIEAVDLEEISETIAPCIRCGKCKPVCNTHSPHSDMHYSPRNKILAMGMIIEAFLYQSQTRLGISLAQFGNIQDVADYCTVCHKCEAPCPVNIDFGEVSVGLRRLLKEKGVARFRPLTKVAMLFLTLSNPEAVRAMRTVVMRWGVMGQRLAHRLAKRLGWIDGRTRYTTPNMDGVKAQALRFIETPLPLMERKTARTALGIEDRRYLPILRHPERAGDEAVFYFPGCGSERMYARIALATEALLYHLGIQVILPPGYLCCGYPASSSGEDALGNRINADNRVLFHRIANTLAYLDIRAVIVSCGTCMDQLEGYELARIFPGARLLDIHEYLMEKGVSIAGVPGRRYLYHEPCHTPMKTHAAEEVLAKTLVKTPVAMPPGCCGEAGTLALSRPDISAMIRLRKEEEVERCLPPGQPAAAETKILTSCPACLQGLSRLEAMGVEADFLVCELAESILGERWEEEFLAAARSEGIERVLF
ncbi:MAG: DUF3683 domain-containing protein [Nitrospirae bacterium]|nr:MAG: DUF3683 domain-containing protein [Nitrospirota bacterium]